MDPETLRSHCLAKAGAVEDFPFGEQVSVFKVSGKIFAIADLNAVPLEVSLKCEPELARALRAQHVAVRAGYRLNKRHWNTVTLDGSLGDDEVHGMIDDSYDLVVRSLTRPQRERLAGPPAADPTV
jgi:predicted DNA-binding protein (MmcQ/YjbR family)